MRGLSSPTDSPNFTSSRKSIKLNLPCPHRHSTTNLFIVHASINSKTQTLSRTSCSVLRKAGKTTTPSSHIKSTKLTSIPSLPGTCSRPSSISSVSSTSGWTASPRTRSTPTVSPSKPPRNSSPKWCRRSRSNSIAPHPLHSSSVTTHCCLWLQYKCTKATTRRHWTWSSSYPWTSCLFTQNLSEL